MLKKIRFSKRKVAIQELIKTYPIEDQAALIALLKERYGIDTNQAAISRDLRNLGIYKRARGQALVYEVPDVDVITEILHYAIQSVQHNEAMIVIKTVPGTAALVADFIDSQNNVDILGTIAGENTVFITPRTTKNIDIFFHEFCKYVKVKE